MSLKIFNTLTKHLEEFVPISPNEVTFYHCGPTVYSTQHIGNMRAVVEADLMRRSMMFLGFNVKFARNYTDVGHLVSDQDAGQDKMAKGAARESLSPTEIADKYIGIFERDVKDLNNLKAEYRPRATEYVQEMIDMVQVLLDKGFAYYTPKAIYFDVSKKEDYNKLNKQDLSKNIAGAGTGDVSDPDKKNPYDFALWFFKTGPHKNALQVWKSPFVSPEVEEGLGFPGWHIECSAMSKSILGDTIDIHMGGIEHIPVHHTNEIAQSESANGKEFVHYWIHNEHLTVDGEKMSKSAGTSYYLEDLINKGYNPVVYRYFLLGSHYRSKQNFTWDALDGARSSYENLVSKMAVLHAQKTEGQVDVKLQEKFISAIEDDFNFPQALAVLWETIKSNEVSDPDKYATVILFDNVLALNLENEVNNVLNANKDIPANVQELLDQRELCRKNKDFSGSDRLRDLIAEAGYIVKDTPDGQKLEIIRK